MAYTALTVTYANTATSATGTSSFIPAYPEYTASTTFDNAFYAARETQCQELIGPLNNLNP